MATARGAESEEEENPPIPGDAEYVEELRERLAARPPPTVAQDYRLEEVAFWNHPHMPAGSVLEFKTSGIGGDMPEATAALLVMGSEADSDGMWIQVSVIGAETEEMKKAMQSYFKAGRRQVHLCRIGASDECAMSAEEGLHLRKFRWHPPGDFRAGWVNSYGLKKVKEGPKMALDEKQGKAKQMEETSSKTPGPGESDTERRLAAFRGKRARVSFGPPLTSGDPSSIAAGGPGSRRVGALRRAGQPAAAVGETLALMNSVKEETIDLTSRSATPRRESKRSKKRDSGLVEAAEAHQRAQTRRDTKRSRERSRSRGRKRRSRKRRRSSSSSRSSGSRTSSSDSSLLPPLRRRSQRQPGSVFRMLEQQAYDFLAQDGVLEDRGSVDPTSLRPKLFTYYQLGIKPALDPRSRDSKEIGLLCRALDMLKEGKLDSLSDLLAARLMAVETATRQGWSTARHLELFDGEDEGSAPAHILLAAQKHGKQVEKAGGKGSWPRSGNWPSTWYGEGQAKGKSKDGKSKGKKGKGKGKGGKSWQAWGASDKEKKDGKNPPDAGS